MKKRINSILIIIVFGLWSTITYKYVGHFFIEKNVAFKDSVKTNFEKLDIKCFQSEDEKIFPTGARMSK